MGYLSEPVTLTLTGAEAWVLQEFLSRFDRDEGLSIEDQAEERILWNLLCLLEKQLVGPFPSQYDKLLSEARAAVRDPPFEDE